MKPRMLVLIVLLVALVALLAYRFRSSAPSPDAGNPSAEPNFQGTTKIPFETPEGREPDGEPAFECKVDIKKEGKQDVAYITVRETHGWWVSYVHVNFWHVARDPDTGECEIDPATGKCRPDATIGQHMMNRPLPFDGAYTDRVVLVEGDHRDVPVGTSEDWVCEVHHWSEVLAPAD